MNRKLGEINGKPGGTLFIAIGQIHGNEPAGTLALKQLFDLIKASQRPATSLEINGKIVGLRGNLEAGKQKIRFIDQDLNRMWTSDRIRRLHQPSYEMQAHEEKELLQLEEAIIQEIKSYPASNLFILDIHTTTAHGGIFSIPVDKKKSLGVAQALKAPVIKGLSDRLRGTLVKYASHNPWGIESSALAFEAGQHQAASSITQAKAALINALLKLSLISRHPLSTSPGSSQTGEAPKYSKIVYRHRIEIQDEFQMKPGFQNFMPIQRGELLARDKNGPIYAPYSGYILMPLYQAQGEDGFFIAVEE